MDYGMTREIGRKKIVRFPREKLYKGDRKPTNKEEHILIQSLHQNVFLFCVQSTWNFKKES